MSLNVLQLKKISKLEIREEFLPADSMTAGLGILTSYYLTQWVA
jgi:hypothetical protein